MPAGFSIPLTQAEFGKLVGVSQQAVSDMVTRGVLSPGATADRWLLEYCGNLREVAAGRVANGDLDLLAERARLAKEQADRIALQNAVTRKQYAPVEILAIALSGAAAQIGVIFDGLLGKIRIAVPDLPARAIEIIAAEHARARNSLADLRIEKLIEDDRPAPAESVAEAGEAIHV